jgi:uroporphyrinogen decarboxylase
MARDWNWAQAVYSVDGAKKMRDESTTPRETFIAALEGRQTTGRVPHFELVFFLTMEAFGRVHPCQRRYDQWFQMEASERQLHREDMADLHVQVAERFEHSAIFIHLPEPLDLRGDPLAADELARVADLIREKTGDRYFLMAHGDATWEVPSGEELTDFCFRLADDPEGMKREAERMVDEQLKWSEPIAKRRILDGFALCSDYCFNSGPFLSPSQFGEFVTPYLAKLIQGYRDMGFYTIKHTDGNVMPIIDQLVGAGPHALHSLDPQGGVDIAVVKEHYGDRICLIGNVSCGTLDTGSDEEVVAAARYALRHGMPNGGYVFSTSNCIYTGMKLSRYELMLDVWRREGNYQ